MGSVKTTERNAVPRTVTVGSVTWRLVLAGFCSNRDEVVFLGRGDDLLGLSIGRDGHGRKGKFALQIKHFPLCR